MATAALSTTADATTTAQTSDTDNPAIPHPAYDRMKVRWRKCRALMDGTEAIREGGEDYLPRYAGESEDSYEVRKNLCALFNAFERTVFACAGLLFAKDPKIGDDMPPKLTAIAEDIDMGGTHLDVYAKQLAVDGLTDGFAGTLVDYPRVDNPQTISEDDEARLNLRPFFVKYVADDIQKVLFRKVRGATVKSLVVLREVTEEQVGRFGVQSVVRYRVYRLTDTGVTWELWREQQSGHQTTREVDPTPMRGVTRIPFSLFVAGRKVSDFEFRPPLENLADLNIEHHQVKTNIRHLESLAMVPTQVRIGAAPDADGNYPPIVLGPRSTIEAPAVEGVPKPIYWHSPDVTVLEPGSRSLQDIKADMGAVGVAFLSPDTRQAETAKAKQIDATAQNATLGSVSRSEQDHLEECFGFAAEFISRPNQKVTAGSVELNREFEAAVADPQMIAALGALAANGKLSLETLWDLLERYSILPDGFDKEAEIKRLLTENALPPEPDANATPNSGSPPGGGAGDTPPSPPPQPPVNA